MGLFYDIVIDLCVFEIVHNVCFVTVLDIE